MTAIQWTHQPGTVGKAWNPLGGCSDADETCAGCYAREMAARIPHMARARGNTELEAKYAGLTKRSAKRGLLQWTGVLRPFPDRLVEPLKQKAPATYFVNSMSDLHHAEVPFEFIAAVYGVMAACPQHTFIVLTKRPDRRREFFQWLTASCADHGGCERDTLHRELYGYLPDDAPDYPGPRWQSRFFDQYDVHEARAGAPGARWPLPNAWEGVSIGNLAGLWRLPELQQTPAAVRLLSLEPQIEDLGELDLTGIHWVINGGESGRKARPFDVRWARDLRDQCARAGVAFFQKQLGAYPGESHPGASSPYDAFDSLGWKLKDGHGGDPEEWPEDLRVRQWPGGSAR
jgi:protein gp37